jgi:RNA polymerase sigma factor (sigma-70 family)
MQTVEHAPAPIPDSPTPPAPRRAPSPLAAEVADCVRRHRDGDSAALTDLTRLVVPWLHHVARAHRLPSHAAEDVVQATLMAMVVHIHELRDPGCGLSWLSVVAAREAVRTARAEQRYVLVDEPDLQPVATTADDPEALALAEVSRAVVRRAVCRLPTRHRVLLERLAQQDRPDYASISTALRMPVGSIGPTRRRGLDRMRILLADDPGWDADMSA